jgi:hypothetical protein
MPELARVLTQEDLRRAGPGTHLDLTPYLAIVDEVTGSGVGGQLTLEEDENQRAQKRRMSLAAKERGYELTWRRTQPGALRFVLARPGELRPGGRPRRPQSSENPAPAGGRQRQPAKRGRS